MRIEVTAEDIAKGRRGGFNCPVAVAMNRAGCRQALAGFYELNSLNSLRSCCETPLLVKAFIKAYDANEDVVPFSFELPDEFLL